mmetsp:Transcript_26757/g.48510  ORF Transcript_26757/g.48510 Transcript_26757/m.48510 type:complete len:92 (-) Transcript_26757:12-287(-)
MPSTLTEQCCETHSNQRISIKSATDMFEDNADTAVLMMDKTIKAIKQRVRSRQFGGINTCHLGYNLDVGEGCTCGEMNLYGGMCGHQRKMK